LTAGYTEFEFDLPGALLTHLVTTLDDMEPAPLNVGSLDVVQETQGIYQLFFDGELVYVGKTDAEAGLLKRLTRHSNKIQHRRNLLPERVTFKAVRIYVFTAMDLETQLIRHYGGDTGTPWNGSGFGANDPGRNRDRSAPGRFDLEFPIDIDRPLEINFTGELTAAQVATRLKEAVPYTFRFQSKSTGGRKPHEELEATSVRVPNGVNTVRTIFGSLIEQLPTGWQATALSAMLILYKEHIDEYPSAIILGRSPD
jgi:hypothetical protein